jgi:hypothetical protein
MHVLNNFVTMGANVALDVLSTLVGIPFKPAPVEIFSLSSRLLTTDSVTSVNLNLLSLILFLSFKCLKVLSIK